MRSGIRRAVYASVIAVSLVGFCYADDLREQVLRNAAVAAGLTTTESTHVAVDRLMASAGKLIFQSRKLSLDHETACATCHVDRFGSADGIPNAIGTEGEGEGIERLLRGGDIIPRNTLPFWGRGSAGFDVFFWDGKVDKATGAVESQFGSRPPSADPLVVAVHLPPVEIGEMVTDSKQNEALKTEQVDTAGEVYDVLLGRLMEDEAIRSALVQATGRLPHKIGFLDVASALASFIRENFKLQPTRFHEFVFGGSGLSQQEVAGGLLFYGKGRCSACHNGAYFTDFEFHGVPFPQVGFGKNGFGVDYGRFNVTLDPADRYKFRTPPLYNVSRTSPYSHSGSVSDLGDAIRMHVDPLALYDPGRMSNVQRVEYYSQLRVWAQEPLAGVSLDAAEIQALTKFLHTLEYESGEPVVVTD